MNEATQKLVEDMKVVAEDARELARETAGQSAEGVANAGEKARAMLESMQKTVRGARQAAVQKACSTARAADDYVRDSPWPFIGTAAVLGLAIGLLLKRR